MNKEIKKEVDKRKLQFKEWGGYEKYKEHIKDGMDKVNAFYFVMAKFDRHVKTLAQEEKCE